MFAEGFAVAKFWYCRKVGDEYVRKAEIYRTRREGASGTVLCRGPTQLCDNANLLCVKLSSNRDVLSRMAGVMWVFSRWHAVCNKDCVAKERRHEHEYTNQPEPLEHP